MKKRIPKFSHLVLKPTLLCTARCATCSTRKTLHRKKSKDKYLDISYWKKMFSDVDMLGVNKLTISGGEPTLYEHLMTVIQEGKKYGWEIGLNTNGSLINEKFALELYDNGLDSVSISLYSSSSDFHDSIRGHKGLWKKAIDAANAFVKIREEFNPNFRVGMQTIICKENYTDFPSLIKLAHTLGFCSITFSYLEGDYQEKKYLLDKDQIISFKNNIIPETIEVIKHSDTDKWAKRIAISAVKSIYSNKRISLEKYAAGIYRRPVPCQIPSLFSIVLANGDVHPCNMVEYTHFPVIGNLHSKSFKEMWESQEWEAFRKEGFDFCRFCPVPLQAIIPVHRKPDYAWAQYGIQNTVLKSIYPHIKKFVLSNRYLFNTVRKNQIDHDRKRHLS